jgi:hypothetical protein
MEESSRVGICGRARIGNDIYRGPSVEDLFHELERATVVREKGEIDKELGNVGTEVAQGVVDWEIVGEIGNLAIDAVQDEILDKLGIADRSSVVEGVHFQGVKLVVVEIGEG